MCSLLKPDEWWKGRQWEGLPVDAGGWALPVQPGQKRDVLMALHLIGMFNCGKMLPPQLNLVLEIEFAEPGMAMRAGGVTEPPVIELQGISAGQLSLVLTQYTPLETTAQHTADIGTNAAAIAALQGQVASTSDLTAAVNLRTTPADVSQLIATALLPFVQQAAVDAALALRDSRLDGHDMEILALQNAGPFAAAGDLNTLQVTLQSAIDGILAEISTLGGATNLVNAPAWLGNVTWDLLAGTNQSRNLHATGPLSIALANDDWTLSFGCDAYTTQRPTTPSPQLSPIVSPDPK